MSVEVANRSGDGGRRAEVSRTTRETEIRLVLGIDGTGKSEIRSGVGFLDHMLELFAKHSLMDLEVDCKGDIQVDDHHTTEDIGLCLGQALDRALGDRKGIRRYGHAILPMDETLVSCALDLGGRPYWAWNAPMPAAKIGTFDSELIADFWQAFSNQGRLNLHVLLHYGRNTHHISEAIFKGLARALRDACEIDPRASGSIPSTQGYPLTGGRTGNARLGSNRIKPARCVSYRGPETPPIFLVFKTCRPGDL